MGNNNKLEPRCLGDGVYAEFDGYHLVLRTGSHLPQDCEDTIYLDPDVMKSLEKMLIEVKDLPS